MAKDKGDDAPQDGGDDNSPERDALIDQATEDRLSGGDDEGAAWAAAFLGGPDDDSPLTPEETAGLNELLLNAANAGDTDAVAALKTLAEHPAQLRKVLADFDPEE